MICDREKRGPISELQKSILRAIVVQTDRTGIQPTQAEIGMRVALSASGVAKHLDLLSALGWVEREGNRAVLIPDDVRAELRIVETEEIPETIEQAVVAEAEAAHG